jgi:hypothetical protein
MSLFIFLIVGFSITNALVFLHVFHWFRTLVSGVTDKRFERAVSNEKLKGFRNGFLGRLIRCHACMGFWVGVSLSLGYGGFISKYMDLSSLTDVIGDGLLLSGSNFVAWVVLRKLGAEEL